MTAVEWYFHRLKCNLLSSEIRTCDVPATRWEKSGSALYTIQNVRKYPELRRATFRLLNRVVREGGMVFYFGIEKTGAPITPNPKKLFESVLRECVAPLDRFCLSRDALLTIVIDEQSEQSLRARVLAGASPEMFGEHRRHRTIKPPIEKESHCQALQCADWISGLIGRVACYGVAADEYPDYGWMQEYFGRRLAVAAPLGGIRCKMRYSA